VPSEGGLVLPATLRVRVSEEQHAIALAHELIGIYGLALRVVPGGWEIKVEPVTTDRLVVRFLSAVERALEGYPTAEATVFMADREYTIRGTGAARVASPEARPAARQRGLRRHDHAAEDAVHAFAAERPSAA